MRYVQTERHQREVAAGRALFGKYRNPFTDRPEVAGLDRTVANTTPVWHAGRLLMTKEDGRPYRVDPRTLATLGRHDFGGRLRSQTVTAHARIDPGHGRALLLRLRGRRHCLHQGCLLHRRQAGQPHPRAVVRCALLRTDARLHDHRELRAVSGLPDHLRSGAPQGRGRPLGARALTRQLGGGHAALRLGRRDALVQGTPGRVLLSHDERVRGRGRAHAARSVPGERECVSLHPACLGSQHRA